MTEPTPPQADASEPDDAPKSEASQESRQQDQRPTGSKQPISLPIHKAMPAPLLAIFVILGLVALGATGFLLLKPSALQPIPIAERRPAPGNGLTHEVVRVVPAPVPSVIPTLGPPCDALAETRWVMGGDGLTRLHAALRPICKLIGPAASEEISQAIEGLNRATIRFAQFDSTGVEATSLLSDRTLYLNLRFANSSVDYLLLLPVLLHEGYHLRPDAGPITAESELAARRAELVGCREFVPIKDWPRWCEDASFLVEQSESEALASLRKAGFA